MGLILKHSLFLLAGIAGVLAVTSPVSAAQDDFVGRLKTCKEVTSIVQRAQCFDTALDDYDLNTLQRSDAGKTGNGWKLATSKSTLTDNLNVTLTLGANDRFTTKNSLQVRPSLVLACNEGRLITYISWASQISRLDIKNDNETNVANTRFGTEPVVAERWLLSTDKTATFIPNPVEFNKKVLNPSGLYIVKLWPNAYYDTISATFDVRGLGEKYQALKDACKLP